jgi:hypothetical protein
MEKHKGTMSLYGIALPAMTFVTGPSDYAVSVADVGTLPLLAALAVGIAVSVGSVIAFLNITTRKKDLRDSTAPLIPEEELSGPDWGQETPDEEEDHSLSDYTIPMAKVLVGPVAAESATEDEPRLCGVAGEFAGASFKLMNRSLAIGRDSSKCGIVFPSEAHEISRKHCTVSFDEDAGLFRLEDHDSSNGTYLADGRRLQPGQFYSLKPGEKFAIAGGEHWFEVQEGVFP